MGDSERQHIVNLYVEQIKYLNQEHNFIQNQFLAGINLPLAALGILIFYIESANNQTIKDLYLLLPFLYLFIPYNLVKYSTRMLSINGYIKHMEKEINKLMNYDVFIWNQELINCSVYPGGFSMITTIGQLPIHIVAIVFLVVKFYERVIVKDYFDGLTVFYMICLILVLGGIILMLVDTMMVQKKVLNKIEIIKGNKKKEHMIPISEQEKNEEKTPV